MRSATRIGREQDQVEAAEQSLASLREQLDALETDFQSQLAALAAAATAPTITEITIRPRKSDLTVSRLAEDAPTEDLRRGGRHPYSRGLLGAMPTLGGARVAQSIPGAPPRVFEARPEALKGRHNERIFVSPLQG